MITTRAINFRNGVTSRVAFISSCDGNWGGSEELWSGTALWLAAMGHQVSTFKVNVDRSQPRIQELQTAGCRVIELDESTPLVKRITNRLLPYHWQLTKYQRNEKILRKHLLAINPQLVVVSQGCNYDGIELAEVCRKLALPYVLLVQKATHSRVPYLSERTQTQVVYQTARRAYFVSEHNRVLTQLQLGVPLNTAEVICNPYNVPFEGQLPWPATTDGLIRLACVARLFLSDKGQDILLQTLAQPKWRQRPIHLTLFGEGPDEAVIRGMVDLLGLQDRVTFGGHIRNISEMWQTHHALVLPSRYEGLPLALVEAMLSGRPAIAADAGGISEILTHKVTGFLAAGLTVRALDEALEVSWANLAQWPAMGIEAARQVRAIVPTNAVEIFGRKLLALVCGASQLQASEPNEEVLS